jgi:hypothetical protein
MRVRLGDVLVRMGILSEAQRDQVVEAQRSSGRPFGALAEELFGVAPRDVERAWAAQYAEISGRVSLALQRIDASARQLIARRQAWQFQILPLRFEGRELLVATTVGSLPRAMRFVGWAVSEPCSFVIATDEDLLAHLADAYPMAGGAGLAEKRRSA